MREVKTKYKIVKSGGLITQIVQETEIQGYTEGVLEIFLPDAEDLGKWTEKQIKKWNKENNIRMESICKFLNENNL